MDNWLQKNHVYKGASLGMRSQKLNYLVFIEPELLPEGGRTKLYKELALLEKNAFCSFSYYLGHG
jgi:hypothetical protein